MTIEETGSKHSQNRVKTRSEEGQIRVRRGSKQGQKRVRRGSKQGSEEGQERGQKRAGWPVVLESPGIGFSPGKVLEKIIGLKLYFSFVWYTV